MAMVEPVINWDNFLKDLDQGMSAYDLQDKYILTPRQYRSIMKNIIRKDGYQRKKSKVSHYKTRSKFNECYVSLRADVNKYIIRKDKVYFGQYDTLETAKKVKQKLIECGWDKSKLNIIRKELGLKPLRGYDL